ncbi:MAG: hypothetical protein ACLVHV_13760 [Oscillospiraceae bacterium]
MGFVSFARSIQTHIATGHTTGSLMDRVKESGQEAVDASRTVGSMLVTSLDFLRRKP